MKKRKKNKYDYDPKWGKYGRKCSGIKEEPNSVWWRADENDSGKSDFAKAWEYGIIWDIQFL